MNSAEQGVKTVLFPAEEIRRRVDEIGADISREYAGKNLLLVSVLKGSFIFMADLVRAITIPCEIDFMSASSYKNSTVSSGKITLTKDLSMDVKDYHVIIVEDILDSGATLFALTHLLRERNPKSIQICTLLDKPARRQAEISADYVGFTIPDEFIIGYGLDYAERFRNLPYIGVYDTSFIF